MGASKTAQALITAFNYAEEGKQVYLCKPEIDTREGAAVMRSRIGLQQDCHLIKADDDIAALLEAESVQPDVIICDEAQFFTPAQIDQLHNYVVDHNIPVICYGLKTDFRTKFFPGSQRLFEVAESLQELKMICNCGRKATVNARLDSDGNVVVDGAQVLIGGNESYHAMCYDCYRSKIRNANRN